MNPPVYLTTKSAATYLSDRNYPLSHRTLEKWRMTGDGPPFHRFGRGRGRIFYLIEDLDAWAKQHRYLSTSEYQKK